jgi:hypothetical protein
MDKQRRFNKLLIDEPPLQVLPRLAQLVGINAAIVLQQIHYRALANIKAGRTSHEGHFWTYNSYKDWRYEFPWLSEPGIKKLLRGLEAQGLIVSTQPTGYLRTKWYRIDYANLFALLDEEEETASTEDVQEGVTR